MKNITMALVIAAMSSPVLAAPGFYGEVLVGNAEQETTAPSVPDVSGSDTSVGVRFGYLFTENFAIESSYQDFGKGSDSYFDSNFNENIREEFETTAWTLGAKGILPLSEQFSLVGRLGVAFWDYDFADTSDRSDILRADDSGNEPFWGVGVEYHMDRFYLGLEYSSFEFDVDSPNLIDGVENKVETLAVSAGIKF